MIGQSPVSQTPGEGWIWGLELRSNSEAASFEGCVQIPIAKDATFELGHSLDPLKAVKVRQSVVKWDGDTVGLRMQFI